MTKIIMFARSLSLALSTDCLQFLVLLVIEHGNLRHEAPGEGQRDGKAHKNLAFVCAEYYALMPNKVEG